MHELFTNPRVQTRLIQLNYLCPISLDRLILLLDIDPTLEQIPHLPIPVLKNILPMQERYIPKFLNAFLQLNDQVIQTQLLSRSIQPILFVDDLYPPEFFELTDPPSMIFVKGDASILLQENLFSIVGSRKATSYTKHALANILPELIRHEYAIVSGLAKGADATAHQLTHQMNGKTVAVLGNGFDHVYPIDNQELYNIIEEKHVMISEYPPYFPPRKWTFPARNRLIAALGKGVLVTEAEEKSGTMSTIHHALDLGRDVFCLPGPILSPLSTGPNRLIGEGAKIVVNAQSILEEYDFLIQA